MTVIVITATIIGLAVLSQRPNASVSGGQFNFEALFSGTMGKQYSMIRISSDKSTVN